MTDLAKQMAPIRDAIARTREKVDQIERLLVTATEAERMEFTSAAECAVEQARRLLAELNGKAGELPKPTPASPKLPCDCAECCGCKTLEEANAWLLANPGKNSLRLLFCKPELFTVGAVFIQLVDLGYAHESRIHGGWVKFAITKKGKAKWKQVQHGSS